MSHFGYAGKFDSAAKVLWKTEGLTDAIAIMSLGLPEGHVACCNACGATERPDPTWCSMMADIPEVFVVHDCDSPGQAGATWVTNPGTGRRRPGWAPAIAMHAPAVRNVVLPYEIADSHGPDVRDWIKEQKAAGKDNATIYAELLEHARSMPLVEPADGPAPAASDDNEGDDNEGDDNEGDDGGEGVQEDADSGSSEHDAKKRPQVILSNNYGIITEEVIRHLGKLGFESPWISDDRAERLRLFCRGKQLVETCETPGGQTSIHVLHRDQVALRITDACEPVIEKIVEGEPELFSAPPPPWLSKGVFTRGDYGGQILPLEGVISSPTIRPDGSILQDDGYDASTRLILKKNASFPKVPPAPTQADAAASAAELLKVIADFPTMATADKSAWIAMLLTMICRALIRSCVPMFVISANIRGAGKSLLYDIASAIAFGHPGGRQTFSRDDAEMRKLITTIAIEASPAVLFDNVDVQIGGASLDAALTAETVSDRILGTSKTTGNLAFRTVLGMTVNNPTYGGDTSRRVLPIRLWSPEESPEDRTGFKHEDLLGWVRSNRAALAVHALTIARAYCLAGRPAQPGATWGSYSEWSAVIRGCIVWAGLDDPLATREAAKAEDRSADALRGLISLIQEMDNSGAGLTTKEICERLDNTRYDEKDRQEVYRYPTAREVVESLIGPPNAKRLGNKFSQVKGRVSKNLLIEGQTTHGGVKRWRVVSSSGGSGHEVNHQDPPSQPANPPDPTAKATRATAENTRECEAGGSPGGFGGFGGSEMESKPTRVNLDKKQNSASLPNIPETGTPEPPKPPRSGRCPDCDGDLIPAIEIGGYRNLDCTSCDYVFPQKIEQGKLFANK